MATLSGNSVLIETEDVSLDGQTVTFEVKAQTPAGYDYSPLSAIVQLTVELSFDCSYDEILAITPIAGQVVRLSDQETNVLVPISFDQISTKCASAFTLEKKMTPQWNELSTFEQSVVSIDSNARQLVIQAQQRSLDGESWSLRLTVASGQQALSVEFTITFRDACRDAILSPIGFAQSSIQLTMFKDSNFQLPFLSGQSDMQGCGQVTHELTVVQGKVSAADLSIDTGTSTISADLTGRKWIGTHQIRVRSHLGTYVSTSAEFTVSVLDPCVDSRIEMVDEFPLSLEAFSDEAVSEVEIRGPANSVSKLYGNGYELCGPVMYSLLNESG